MSSRSHSRGRGAALGTVVAVLAALQALAAPLATAQAAYVPISGSGSTWSFNALDQWRRNVQNLYGIQVNFAATGSSQGRVDFTNGAVDFAVSEIEYGLTDGGVTEPPPRRGFAYMPIVAGGTSFMYNLKIGNTRVTNLRLSSDTIAKIFTRVITNWADPAIHADNPGLTLPARPIVPVVRADGSGTTAQFTRYLAAKQGPTWDAYCGRPSCGFTSNYPVKAGVVAKSGSLGVAGFVSQDNSEGAITYVEYSYAQLDGFPVVKVLNQAGYYVEPTAPSVAVALTAVKIRPDLTSDLSGVYNYADPRTYPLSSYSYMIIPTDNNGGKFTAEKGRTLSDFAYYFLCQGQQNVAQLGYSPLPINLVQAGVTQVARIPGTTNKLQATNLAGCNNPTLSASGANQVALTAPQPSACDKFGATAQCENGTAGAKQNTPTKGGVVATTTGGTVTAAGTAINGGAGAGGAGGGGPGTAAAAGAAGTAGAGTGTAGAAAAGTGATGTGAAGTGTSAAGGATGGTAAGGAAVGGTAATGATAAGGTAAGTAAAAPAVDAETGELVGGGATADGGTGGVTQGTGTSLASNVSAVPVEVALPNDAQRGVLVAFAVILLLALILAPPLVSRSVSRREDGP